MKTEYSDLIKELDEELYFESKVLTRDQCHGSLTRHKVLYERALEILENWHEIKVDELSIKKEVDTYENKLNIAIKKLKDTGYKKCSINFNLGVIQVFIDRSVFNLEKYLSEYEISKTSEFYYQERSNYCDLITVGLGMQNVKNGYINGSAFIDKKYIIDEV